MKIILQEYHFKGLPINSELKDRSVHTNKFIYKAIYKEHELFVNIDIPKYDKILMSLQPNISPFIIAAKIDNYGLILRQTQITLDDYTFEEAIREAFKIMYN